jgi:alkylhydroperoxidase family enzyme
MGFFARVKTLAKVMRRRQRPVEILALLRKRPALLLAVNAYETALLVSGRVDEKLKALAQVKTSALIGCPF